MQALRTALPLILYVILVFALFLMQSKMVWDPPMLLPAINLVLLVAALASSALAAVGFIHEGSQVLLTLSLGVLLFGLANSIAPVLNSLVSNNAGVTTHNTLVLAASVLFLHSVFGAARKPVSIGRSALLLRMVLGVVLLAAAIAAAAATGLLPDYIASDGRPTVLRQLIVNGAALAFVAAAVGAAQLARASGQRFMRWYSVGLGFIATGLLAVSLGPVGSAIGWAGRLGQMAGQFYILATLAGALRDPSLQSIEAGAAVSASFRSIQDALNQSQAELAAAMDSMNEGVLIVDAEQRAVKANAAFMRHSRLGPNELLPQDSSSYADVFEILHPDLSAVPVDELPVARALRGETAPNQEYALRRRATGETWMVSNSLAPIRDARGSIVGAVMVVRDITEQKEAEAAERLRLRVNEAISRIERAIYSSLDRAEMLGRVAEESVLAIGADSMVLLMREGDEWVVRYTYNNPAAAVGIRYSFSEAPFWETAVRSGEPVAIEDAYDDPRTVRETQEKLGVRAVIVTPLIARGEAIGALFLNFGQPRRFSSDDLRYVSRVGTSLGLALYNISLYEAERRIAETLQESLVTVPESVPGVVFSRSYLSATPELGRVGGDFVDIFEVHPDLVAVTLGDVSGKGLDAAVTTGIVRNILRGYALDEFSAETVVEKTNRALRKFTESSSFVTLWFGLLTPSTGRLQYVNAGHPPGLVLRSDAQIRELQIGDPFIGTFAHARYTQHEYMLKPGERLVLYSDGTIEARSLDGAMLRESGLRELLALERDAETTALARSLLNRVVGFSAGVLRDDAAVLVVELA